MEPILHIIIPALTLLAMFPKIDRMLVLKLLPLTVLLDFDFFMGHRFLFHNIFFVLAVSGVAYMLFKNKRLVFLIALFFLSSHIILDMSDPGVGLLYPVYDKLISFNFIITTSPTDGKLTTYFSVLTKPFSEAIKDQEAPIFTMNGILMLILIAPVIASIIYENRKRLAGVYSKKRDSAN
jgi:membrane-bound metal-dependent hydrolase YbcI (DUF457 family)